MNEILYNRLIKLSVIIPCYNEEASVKRCVEKVLSIGDEQLSLEIIIVDDKSTDQSLPICLELKKRHPEITILRHENNKGKGAALRTGFKKASGDFVAVQDADLEYDPMELKKLLVPLINDYADVVLGSRFLSTGAHRVLYFWHFLGNHFLTFLSNMFTDMNLTDMETCYKVFKREVIQSIEIKEDRFGFEPEIVAKVSHMRLRVYEIGISYYGRTYAEGKKIGAKDGLRAIYCIFRYNAYRAPIPVQFLIYVFIGGIAAILNLISFLGLFSAGFGVSIAAPIAFVFAALVNYFLCILLLFRHKAQWNTTGEQISYWLVVSLVCLFDLASTRFLLASGFGPGISKALSSMIGLILNFIGRRFFVFSEPSSGPWKP